MNGPFIVIEGSDGSGKTTQFKLLTERLRAVGYGVDVFDFPRYDEPSAYFVKSYLNGEYGPASQINPYTASMFYALDRFAAAKSIKDTLAAGNIALSNRFTGSNMAHQGSKFASEAEQRGYFLWADSLEFQLLGIPRPVINIFLRVPADTAYALIAKKSARSYTPLKRDEHEADIDHLKKSVETYDLLCRLFPKDYLAIDCAPDGRLLSVAAINDLIWEALQPYLSDELKRSKPSERLVKLADEAPLSPASVLPAVGRRGQVLKSVSLLAVRELSANRCKVLTLKLEAGKDRQADFIPLELAEFTNNYRSTIKELMVRRRSIVKKINSLPPGTIAASEIHYIEDALLPMAAKVSASFISAGNSQRLASRLAQKAGKEFSAIAGIISAQSVTPPADRFIARSEGLRAAHNLETAPVNRLDVTPRAETSFLTDYLFSVQPEALAGISEPVDSWDYDKKQSALEDYFARLAAGRAPEPTLSYRFEIMADDPTIRQLISGDCLIIESAQSISPRFGYEIPESLEQNALADDYLECFDLSLKLFSDIEAAGYSELSAYAALAGHKSRWRASAGYSQLVNLRSVSRSSAATGAFKQVAAGMLESVAEVHPTLYKHLMSLKPQPLAPAQVPPARQAAAASGTRPNSSRSNRRRQTAKKRK